MSKVFDILIKSGFNPEGAKAAEEELRKIGVTADKSGNQAQSMFDKLEQGGMKLMRAGQGFRQLGDLFGSQNLANIGNMVGGVGALSNSLGELAGIINRIASIKIVGPLAFIFGAAEVAKSVSGGITQAIGLNATTAEDAVNALQRMENALNKLSPEEKARKIDEISRSVSGLTGTDKVNAINAWSRSIETGENKLGLFTTIGDAVTGSIKKIAAGLEELKTQAQDFQLGNALDAGAKLFGGLKSIEDQVTAFRTDAATERRHLLENIAIAEGRRLQDIARNNARQLQSIDQQRTDALSAAADAYAATLASIDQSSADNRVRIEEDYQERIRQIKEGSGASIEDAIERRDARALAKALQSQAQQLNQAERDHDKQLADNAKAAEQQKAQAAKAYDDQKRAAEEAARVALETLRENDRLAADEQRIATDRALQDFDLAKLREQQALTTKLRDQYTALQTAYNQQQTLYRSHLNAITSITSEATRPQSTLATAIVNFVQDTIGDVIGSLTSQTTPQRGR